MNDGINIDLGDDGAVFRQIRLTANAFLHAAITDIDETWATGYAHSHPELVAGYMQTCATLLRSARTGEAVEAAADKLATAMLSVRAHAD